jgi:hypothetical protein
MSKFNEYLEKVNPKIKEAMKHADKPGAGAKKRKKLKGKDKVEVVMKEFKRGTLHSGSGKKVTDRKQAIAIAMSEAGPMYAPKIGSTKTNLQIVSYPMDKIKVGQKFIAKRDGDRLINKDDKIEITKIEKGPYRSLIFYGLKNGKLNAHGEPFELVDLELAIGD